MVVFVVTLLTVSLTSDLLNQALIPLTITLCLCSALFFFLVPPEKNLSVKRQQLMHCSLFRVVPLTAAAPVKVVSCNGVELLFYLFIFSIKTKDGSCSTIVPVLASSQCWTWTAVILQCQRLRSEAHSELRNFLQNFNPHCCYDDFFLIIQELEKWTSVDLMRIFLFSFIIHGAFYLRETVLNCKSYWSKT